MPKKRGAYPKSGASLVRRNALTEPPPSSEKRPGGRPKQREQMDAAKSPAAIMTLLRANDHCQTSYRSDTKNLGLNPSRAKGAGERGWRDTTSQTRRFAQPKDSKKPRSV